MRPLATCSLSIAGVLLLFYGLLTPFARLSPGLNMMMNGSVRCRKTAAVTSFRGLDVYSTLRQLLRHDVLQLQPISNPLISFPPHKTPQLGPECSDKDLRICAGCANMNRNRVAHGST